MHPAICAALAPFAPPQSEVHEGAKAGTPQAAGVSYADHLKAVQALRAIPLLAAAAHHANPRHHRKPGESRDDFALRQQIDASPGQWQ